MRVVFEAAFRVYVAAVVTPAPASNNIFPAIRFAPGGTVTWCPFVGFVPVENPEIVVLVVVDEPQKRHYGGVVAAPVFRRIIRETLRYLKVPPELATPEFTGSGRESTRGNRREDQRRPREALRVSFEAPAMG